MSGDSPYLQVCTYLIAIYVTRSDKIGLIAHQILTTISTFELLQFFCELYYKFLITDVEIYGDFTETYRIGIAYIKIEICIIKQTHVFYGYKPHFVRLGHIY